MYHVLEILIVGVVVGIAGYAVLSRYGGPLLRLLRQPLYRLLMQAPATSWAHRMGVHWSRDIPHTAGCGNGCGDESACGSCSASTVRPATTASSNISHTIKIVRRPR